MEWNSFLLFDTAENCTEPVKQHLQQGKKLGIHKNNGE